MSPLTLPRIISVDDHVVEPPDLWTSRVSRRFGDRIPHVERDRAKVHWRDGQQVFERGSDDGEWCDWWVYEDYSFGFPKIMAAVGFEDLDNTPTTFDEIRRGTWIQHDRLIDMSNNYVDSAVCFPNTLPRFCGQTFSERKDKELALFCVRAYNDWLIDDWCSGEGRGRLIPAAIVPLWDVELAAAEVRRCADKGSYAITFSENPAALGLPSLYGGYWDPLFKTCSDTETTVCLHIGSSSKMFSTSKDAPFIISSTLTFVNAMGSILDFIFSGTLERVPGLTLVFSEGQIGWMPYLFERADKLWKERGNNSFGSFLTNPPSDYLVDRVYGCIFDDETGLRNRDVIGTNQICLETDYPHADSTFPETKEIAAAMCSKAGLSDDETYRLLRGNAIKAFGLKRFGITS